MADVKKYVDLIALGKYDTKIKELIDTKDAATLSSAKSYANGLADNYDAAGAAGQALVDAKSYTDGKVTELNTAIADAKKAGTDAATAASNAQAAAEAAQNDVDALETLVGALPEETVAKDVIGYIDEKTTGIATNTALGELQTQVNTNKTDIATIKGDYLKAADKTELQGNIDGVSAKVTTLIGTDADKSVRTIANEELAAQLVPENAKESLDTLAEIAAWIQNHPDNASAMNSAITALQNKVGTIPEGTTASTIVAYIQEVVAAERSRAEGAENGLDTRLDAVETKLGSGAGSVTEQIATAKQEAIDAAAGDATTKANQALADAKTYTNGKIGTVEDGTTVVGMISGVSGRVTTLEGASHTHSNKTVLDGITAEQVGQWDSAYDDKHTHTNKTVLDGITTQKVEAWDGAEGNAKSYADGLVAQFVAVTEDEINAMFTTA